MLKHLAIIMDGNGRWATSRGKDRTEGHIAGAKAVLKAIAAAEKLEIPYLTLYAFSTENFKRAPEEVSRIFGIIAEFLRTVMLPKIREKNFRMRFMGEFQHLSPDLMSAVSEVNAVSINNTGMTIIVAIGYGGREEICRAVDCIMKERFINCDDSPVSYAEIERHLYTATMPDPDVVLRYGGYQRLSNFLPLQCVYSELFFIDRYWPDFAESDVEFVATQFDKIKRNFGEVPST